MLKAVICIVFAQYFLLGVNGQLEFTCPPGAEGFYGYEGYCIPDYVFCSGGEAYPYRCNDGQVFDPALTRCVPLADASCKDWSSPTFSTTESTATTTSYTCPKPDGVFPIPGECSSYHYTCVGGTPYIEACPGDAIFDPATLLCTPPASASCKQPFECPDANGFFAIPGACSSSYYACIDNVPFLKTCPGSAIFDPDTRKCVAEEQAPCKRTTSTSTSSTTTPTTTSTTTTPTTTSTTTTSTTSTTTTPTTTSTTTTSTTSTTTTPTTTSTTTTTTTRPTSELPFACPGMGEFPYGKCSQYYYVCQSAGLNWILSVCLSGQVFDSQKLRCDDPANVAECSV